MEQHRAYTRRDADDAALMRRAIGIAESAQLRARPNPWVGAVVVCVDGTVFEGSTSAPGGPHAEIVAMNAARDAGALLTGATVYSTLEPCSHTGRTGPCADALVEAGVSRVVVGIVDPDPKVSGKGIDRLAAAGIEVETGVLAEEVREQLAPYIHHRTTGRPFVMLKMATTLDAKTSIPRGERWITGETARTRVHQLRAESDAIVVGAGTIATDDPELTVRHVDGPSPRRIVMTRTGAVPAGAKVQPCTVWRGGIEPLLDELGADGVIQLMVEGGPTLAGAFHEAGLVNRYVFHVAPVIAGDDGAAGVFSITPDERDHALLDTHLVSATVLGDDLELILEPLKETAA
ncbi:MAG: diaminohydroxyphosphoribosylaminopyrimidine deaminase [Actinomycetota bacterium]